ncbi:hypothetical protein CSB88_2420 [Pseudomonas aeruginosa]|nr:hypothetical protein CSB88_2420 [Pseudomonas aeruginosa]
MGQSAQAAIDKHTTSKAVSMITPKVVWLISRFLLSQVDTCRPDYHTYRQRKGSQDAMLAEKNADQTSGYRRGSNLA